MASGNKGKRFNDNSESVGRIEALTKHITKTMAEVSADMLPVLGAVGKEVLFEAQSDVPKITQEMGSQVTHLSTLRKSRQHSP
jgi:archaellum component FlaC